MKRKTFEAVKILGLGAADWIVKKGDGTLEARGTFFYRHGGTSEKFATRIEEAVGVKATDCGEVWRAWPKDSFWWARFTITDEAAVVEKAKAQLKEWEWEGTWAEAVKDVVSAHEPVR